MFETTTHRRTRQPKGQLTDLKLRNLETRDKPYKVAEGNGLFVLVSPSGLRAWRWKYRFAGKEKVLPLGKYPDVTLADARRARDEARNKVLANVDPLDERRDAKFALLSLRDSVGIASADARRRRRVQLWGRIWDDFTLAIQRQLEPAEQIFPMRLSSHPPSR